MRIIAGRLGGRQFESPRGHRTHPMSDKIRGALFNILGDIKGLTLLDCFAGSGALSLEAASRGARPITTVDNDTFAIETITRNVASLGLDQTIFVRRQNVASWSNVNRDKQFDIVLADPPYNDLQPGSIERLPRHVISGGLLVLSWPNNTQLLRLDGVEQLEQRFYGDATLLLYRAL